MELNQYLKIIRRNLLFIAATTAIALLLGNFVSRQIKHGFALEQSFVLITVAGQPPNVQPNQPSTYYDYSGYFEQEKARNFTDTAVAIFQSQDFARTIISPTSSVTVQKSAPQVLKVTINSQNISEAKFDMDRLTLQFNQKLLSLSPQDSLQIVPIGTPQEPVLSKFDPKIITAASALLGTTISIALIAIKSYFKL